MLTIVCVRESNGFEVSEGEKSNGLGVSRSFTLFLYFRKRPRHCDERAWNFSPNGKNFFFFYAKRPTKKKIKYDAKVS